MLAEQLELPLKVSPIEIREFRLNNQVEDIIPLARECAKEIPLAGIDFDELMLRVSLGALLRNETRNYQNLFIAYKCGDPVGFFLASIGHSWYADRTVAHEELWYVTPSERGHVSIDLLRAFEHWAQSKGATIALAGSNNELSSERTSKLLSRLGYRQIGVTHVKEL